MTDRESICPDCDGELTRRDFVKAAVVATGSVPILTGTNYVQAAPTGESKAESTVKHFYDTLSDDQKKVMCLPWSHKNRTRISANWAITEPALGDDFYTKKQRNLVDKILRQVASEDGYERFKKQMDDDDGGVDAYHVAVFGAPGTGKFEWVMTGRHLTIRADGDTVKNMAFGGPIIYGHGVGDPKKNLFYYQTKKAYEVFTALNADQADKALLPKAPPESKVPIQGTAGRFPGVSIGDLSSDQKELVESAIKVMLAPYRQEDVDEALTILKSTGGLDKLHMAFYQEDDLNKDEVWDIWRIEGPSFVWHFRGAPHVHTYVNIGLKG